LNWLGGLVRKGWLALAQRPTLVGMSHECLEDNVTAYLTSKAWGQRLARHYLGYCYVPFFDVHLANSDYTAAELRAAMVPGHERPIHVLPMGADIESFAKLRRNETQRQRLLAQLGGNERTRLLLFAGRLSPEKNLPLLLQMMERLASDTVADYRLLIAGAGPLSAELERAAFQRLPRHVYLLGHLGNKEQLLELYANCDAFVHHNPREPFGIAPLEALAAGLPLVAPQTGGVLSYADESNAWLAEPQNEAFAQAVRAIFSDPDLCKAKLSRARWRAAQFNWATVTAAFFARYEEFHQQFSTARRLSQPLAPALNHTLNHTLNCAAPDAIREAIQEKR
jgi:glycosyltransferase involved in cell wall biosynthesis